MARVLVDSSAVLERVNGVPGPIRLAPGAADALRHLTEADLEVVLLDPPGDADVSCLPAGVEIARDLPASIARDTWFLTADPQSRFGRPRGTHTILVGPRRAPGPLPLPRYDVEARDLSSAVIEILARQAMA